MSPRWFLQKATLVIAGLLLPLFLARGETIAGRITEADGKPVAGAQITGRLVQSDFSTIAVSQEDGRYALEPIPAGVYTITVRKTGYADLTQEEVPARNGGETIRLDLRLRPDREEKGVGGVEELNPNVFTVKLDTNELIRQLYTRGASPQLPGEFRSQENYYGAVYGYPLRRVDLTKPGPLLQVLHGSVYEAHQNSALNARPFFNVGELRPSRRNEYGATVGGPIVRDKVSFNFAWSQIRDAGYVNGNVQVPWLDERIPRSADPTVNAMIGRLLEGYPKEIPNLCSPSEASDKFRRCHHLNTNALRDIRSTAFSTRLDYRPRATDQVVFEQRFFDATEEPFELVAGQNPVTFLRPQSLHLTHVHTFSPRTVSRVSFNFDRLAALLDVTERYKNLLAPLGIRTVPEISFGRSGDFSSLGPGPDFPRRRVENRFHFAPEVSQVRGQHTLTAGMLVSRFQMNDLESENSRGVFEFNANKGQSAVGNFLLGRPTSFKINLGNLYRGFRHREHAFYFHDTIRLSSDWTLSLGLRYEVLTAPTEVNNLTVIPYRTDANNFAPQFGFGWNPGKGKTVVRGGYGLTFGTTFPILYARARFNPPAVQVISVDEEKELQALFRGGQLRSGKNERSGLNLLSPDLVAPYTHVYTLVIERELPTNLQFRVGYMGSRTFKLPWKVATNRAKPVPGIPTTTATINDRRPDPRYREIMTVANGTIAYFDALQVSVDKRIGKGLSWNARYTFSKAINTGDTTFVDTGLGRHTSTDEDIVRDLKGPEAFDTPHALTIGYRFELPGSRLKGLQLLLNNWKISGTTTFRSGTPYMIHTGSDAPGFGNVDGVGGDRPNILNPAIIGKSVDHPDTSRSILRREDFDTNIPPGGRGNLGFNTARLDGVHNWNFAAERNFRLGKAGEGTPALLLRAEFFNFLNQPQFDTFGPHVANETFGTITNTVNKGRVIQFMLRVGF